MWSYVRNCRIPFLIFLLSLTEFREIALLFRNEGHWSTVCGAPVTPKPGIDPMNYLRNYGYLSNSRTGANELRSTDEFQSAIRRFQRMTGVTETGRMDQQTISMMRRPRCGRPDVAPQEFTAGPNRWEKWDLTYRFLSYTRDLSETSVERALSAAFRFWSSVTPFNFERVSSGRQADVIVSFSTGDHNDGYPFDGTGGVLAHAFPPGDESGGDIHFDDDESWTEYSDEGTNLQIVAAHEIGHSLGLLHSRDHNALMFPVYQGYQRNFRLGSDDIRGIQSIYGSRSRPITARPRLSTVSRTSSPSPGGGGGDGPIPQLCSAQLDAVANIRSEIFVFHRKWFWRLRRDDDRPAEARLIASFWFGLPKTFDRVDAVFENPTNGRIFFFSGNSYWEFDANRLAGDCPAGGRRLHQLGLPPSVERIDAAVVLKGSRSTAAAAAYVFSGDAYYWRLNTTTRRAQRERLGGATAAAALMGNASLRLDAAFTNFDNRTYLIRGSQFWRLKENAMQVEKLSSQKTPHLWSQCRSEAISSASRPSTQILYHTSLFIFLCKCTSSLIRVRL